MWRRTMPQEQTREFNRLIGLMNATNMYLPLFITMVELNAEQKWLRLNWWSIMNANGTALWRLGALVPPGKRKAAGKAMEEVYPSSNCRGTRSSTSTPGSTSPTKWRRA